MTGTGTASCERRLPAIRASTITRTAPGRCRPLLSLPYCCCRHCSPRAYISPAIIFPTYHADPIRGRYRPRTVQTRNLDHGCCYWRIWFRTGSFGQTSTTHCNDINTVPAVSALLALPSRYITPCSCDTYHTNNVPASRSPSCSPSTSICLSAVISK